MPDSNASAEIMGDAKALQGLWKVDSITRDGRQVGYSVTHWEFEENRVREIDPSRVEGGTWAPYTLDTTTTPKHLESTYSVLDRKTGEPRVYAVHHAYAIDGDTLRIGGAVAMGRYPDMIDDAHTTVTVLSRYQGPRPATKQPSGKKPLESAVLGTLTWNDNRDTWEASVAFASGESVPVAVDPPEDDPDQIIPHAEKLVTWAKENETAARAYAAEELIALAEDWRDPDIDADPITTEAFAKRIKMESLTCGSSGSVTFWFDDDQIFAGHVIAVSTDDDRNFEDAQIMG